MTIWDTITGRKSSSSSGDITTSSSSSSSSSPSFSSDDMDSNSAFDTSSLNVSSFLVDTPQFDPLANVSQESLDYLALEDSLLSDLPGSRSALPSRGWSDDLCYGTGCTYLVALATGGVWGFAEGVRRVPPMAPPKLRLNAILNGVTRRGPFLGNNAGVIALIYNGINSYIGHVRGKHDAANSIAAGALTGALFKSTKGTKPMLISSGLVATAAGVWAFSRKVLF